MQERSFSVTVSGVRLSLTVWENHFRLSNLPNDTTPLTQLKAIHRHGDYEMFILPSSTLTVHTLDQSQEFSDSIVIVPPETDHYVTFDEALCGYYLYFSIDKISAEKEQPYERLTEQLKNGIVVLPLSADELFYTQKLSLALETPAHREMLPHLFSLLFGELFFRLLPQSKNEVAKQTTYARHVNTIDYYISLHYAKPLRLSDLARELYLCPKQVTRILQKEYGCSFSELVNRHRLSAACMLLRYTVLEIGEIAAQVGYEYENYFYTVFRKAYGITPGAYRKQYKKPTQ